MANSTLALMGESVLLFPSQTQFETISSSKPRIVRVYKTEEAGVVCRSADNADVDEDGHVAGLIASFHAEGYTCVLEPYVDDVTVESPLSVNPSRPHAKRVAIPRSIQQCRRYLYLRSGDTLDFQQHNLKISITLDMTEHGSASIALAAADVAIHGEAVPSEVQVQSSNAEPEVEPQEHACTGNATDNFDGDDDDVGEDDDHDAVSTDDDDDDDDLDKPPSTRTSRHHTAHETFPAIATPQLTEPTVKETPSHVVDNDGSADDDQSYSTARDRPGENTTAQSDQSSETPVDGPGSPSLQVQNLRHGSSPADTARPENLVVEMRQVIEDAAEISDVDEEVEVRSVKTTYLHGRRGAQRNGPMKPFGIRDSPQESPRTGYDEIAGDTTDADTDMSFSNQPKLDAATPAAVSRKRKSVGEEVDSPQQEEEAPEGKRTKIEAPEEKAASIKSLEEERSKIETFVHDEEGEQTDEDRLRSASRFTTGYGKLKNASSSRTSTQESGETIAVAASKTSPRVVVAGRLPSKSPMSSATSPTSKAPKILLSSESSAQKNAALKKWLTKIGASLIDTIPSKRTHFVCVVPPSHSLRSAKVLHSLAMNQLVVRDDWLTTSKKKDELLDPKDFLHETLVGSTADRASVFAGKRLLFTQSVVTNYKTAWTDIKDVAREAGAIEVDQVDFNKPTLLEERPDVVFFGSEDVDGDAAQLINDFGRTVFSKELFTRSIISGELNPSEEDELVATQTAASKRKSRRS